MGESDIYWEFIWNTTIANVSCQMSW